MGLPWQTASVFADRSRSGFDDADKRPVYGDLLAQMRAGRCDMVIVTELIILTADMTQFAALLELVRGGYLRLLTLDGLDTGWLGEGRSGPRHAGRRG
jgi:DNA invertase Pin-like site-specific DNA recombinase